MTVSVLDGFVIEIVNTPSIGPVSSPSDVAKTETVEVSASSLIVVVTEVVPNATLIPVELDGPGQRFETRKRIQGF